MFWYFRKVIANIVYLLVGDSEQPGTRVHAAVYESL